MNRVIKPDTKKLIFAFLLMFPLQLLAYQQTHDIAPDFDPLTEDEPIYNCSSVANMATFNAPWGQNEPKDFEVILVHPDGTSDTVIDYSGYTTINETVKFSFTFPDVVGDYDVIHNVIVYTGGYDSNGDPEVSFTSQAQATFSVVTVQLDQPASIQGNYRNCNSREDSYTVAAVNSATGYDWSVPAGWSIIHDGVNYGTDASNLPATVILNSPATGSGTAWIRVRARDNGDQCEGVSIWKGRQLSYGAVENEIAGESPVEPYSQETYMLNTIGTDPGSYQWTLPSGWTVQNSTASSIVYVTVGQGGFHTISIDYTSCDIPLTASMLVQVVSGAGGGGGMARNAGTIDESGSQLNVYPVPARESVTISAAVDINKLIIYDMQGKPVREFSAEGNTQKINIEGLKKGVYLLHALYEGGKDVSQIIIE